MLYEYATTWCKAVCFDGQINIDVITTPQENIGCKMFKPVEIIYPAVGNSEKTWELVGTTCEQYSINWFWRRVL